MHFTLIKHPTSHLKKQVVDFCLRSKPYSFCELPSRQLRLVKINEYVNFLLEESDIYVLEVNESVRFFIALTVSDTRATIDFCFAEPYHMIRCFSAFRQDFFIRYPKIKEFHAVNTRTFKLDSYIKTIKRYDNQAKFKLDNSKMCIYWYS